VPHAVKGPAKEAPEGPSPVLYVSSNQDTMFREWLLRSGSMCGKVVAYYRVSTDRQGRSGLGLDAQRAAVEGFIRERGGELVQEFVEVESGKRNDRPELARAIQAAKLSAAKLLIAKLDRLSRNAAFLLALRDSGARFVAVDMPEADNLTIGILALVAEREREMISARTRAALAAAKARGRKLGNLGTLRPGAGREKASAAHREAARAKASELAVVVEELRAAGHSTAAALARELTRRGIVTPRGKAQWSATQVQRVLTLAAMPDIL
jgi:DNA invertase Pin-like site-specific DNA recombinase